MGLSSTVIENWSGHPDELLVTLALGKACCAAFCTAVPRPSRWPPSAQLVISIVAGAAAVNHVRASQAAELALILYGMVTSACTPAGVNPQPAKLLATCSRARSRCHRRSSNGARRQPRRSRRRGPSTGAAAPSPRRPAPAAAAWPAVSVTVITRARPAFAHALANLAAQDYPRSRLEVLVVDDTPGRAGAGRVGRAAPRRARGRVRARRLPALPPRRRAARAARREAQRGGRRARAASSSSSPTTTTTTRRAGCGRRLPPLARRRGRRAPLRRRREACSSTSTSPPAASPRSRATPLVQPCSMAFRRDLWSGEDDGDGGGARLTALDGARARADARAERGQRRRAEAAGLRGAPRALAARRRRVRGHRVLRGLARARESSRGRARRGCA